MASAADLRRAALAVLLAISMTMAATAPADAARKARICASRTAVLDSPGGFTVGYLFRGDRVRIARRSANRRWVRVTTPTDLRGWIPVRALCR